MNTFFIHESNLERLEKKLTSIQNKCNKYQFSFTYRQVGEEFRTITDEESGKEYTARYVVVEVEGEVKHNGWEFIAVLDHHETGNVIRAYKTDIEVPERYRTCGPTCEHCNKIRSRKDTYIIHNVETDEFKQVGRNCLQEFTNGLDAEQVAAFMQCFEEMEKGYGYYGSHYESYMELDEVLRYAFECVKHFGYEKAYDDYGDPNPQSTRRRVSSYMNVHRLGWYSYKEIEQIEAEMNEVGFNADSEYAVNVTKEALAWIAANEDTNQYISNLKVICSDDYIKAKDFGIAVSLPAAYNRYLANKKYEEKKAAQQSKEASTSEYQGEVGQRLIFVPTDVTCLTTIESYYGTTWLYKITDENDNVYIWYASSPIKEDTEINKLAGTVKQHSEYDGVKQTVLTRCKVS